MNRLIGVWIEVEVENKMSLHRKIIVLLCLLLTLYFPEQLYSKTQLLYRSSES
jgi:hypothetical protein